MEENINVEEEIQENNVQVEDEMYEAIIDLDEYVKKQTEYNLSGYTCYANYTVDSETLIEGTGTKDDTVVYSDVFLRPMPQYFYTEGGFTSVVNWNGVFSGAEFYSNASKDDALLVFRCNVGNVRNEGIQMTQTQTKIINVPDPVDDGDAVNKKYVDDIVGNVNTILSTLTTLNGGN